MMAPKRHFEINRPLAAVFGNRGRYFAKKRLGQWYVAVGNGCNLHFARAQFDEFFLQQMVNDYYCCTLEN